MPTAEVKKSNKISIGFGLEGYVIESKQSPIPTSVSTAGMSGYGGTVEVNGDYVVDDSLKQGFYRITFFQTFPLSYNENGIEKWVSFKDMTALLDGSESFSGGLSLGQELTCPDLGPSYVTASNRDSSNIRHGAQEANTYTTMHLKKIISNLKSFYENKKIGNGKDFVNGVALSTVNTTVPYFNHFYPSLGITKEKVWALRNRGLLNVEVVFRWGSQEKGRAFRFKVVDDGPPAATLDLMGVILATNPFNTFTKFSGQRGGKQISDALREGYSFPFSNEQYDYKSGVIPGYGPQWLMDTCLKEMTTEITGTARTTFYENLGNKVRVRIFIDEDRKGEALSLVPNLPDEIFKTNYQEGEETSFGTSTSKIELSDDVNANILKVAAHLDQFIKNTNKQKANTFTYGHTSGNSGCAGGGQFVKKATQQQVDPIWLGYDGEWIFLPNNASDGFKLHTDCSHYVTWVLNECQIISSNYQYGTATMPSGMSFQPGYKYIKLNSVGDIMPGDLLLWKTNGRHHAGIAAQQGNNSLHYGMGATSYMTNTANPHNDPSASEFYRIVKT